MKIYLSHKLLTYLNMSPFFMFEFALAERKPLQFGRRNRWNRVINESRGGEIITSNWRRRPAVGAAVCGPVICMSGHFTASSLIAGIRPKPVTRHRQLQFVIRRIRRISRVHSIVAVHFDTLATSPTILSRRRRRRTMTQFASGRLTRYRWKWESNWRPDSAHGRSVVMRQCACQSAPERPRNAISSLMWITYSNRR